MALSIEERLTNIILGNLLSADIFVETLYSIHDLSEFWP